MAVSSTSSSQIDVQGIVSQLMTVERQPLQAVQKKVSGVDTKISAIGKVKSALSALQTASRGLTNVDTWRAATGSSGDDKAIGVTVTAGAPPGSFPIRVDQLARPQTAMSGQFDSGKAVIGGGTLTIQMGTWDDTAKTFAPDAARAGKTVTIADGATLADVRTAINAAAPGINATLVNDGGKVRLMLRGTESGAANAFTVTATGAGLGQMTVDPTGGGALPLTQTALDAKYNFGGVDMTSSSNTVTNAVDGMSLTLRKAGPDPVEIQIATDTDAIRKSVDAFVSAYNDAIKTIGDLTKYNADTKTAATLQGNSTINGLVSKVKSMISDTVGTGTLATLSAAGIEVQRDGTLAVKDAKFKAAAAAPGSLRTLFSNTDNAAPGNVGIARRLDAFIQKTLGVDGSLTGSMNSLQSSKTRLNDQTDRINRQLVLTEKRLTKLYSSLDSNLSKISSATGYISQINNTNNG